MRRTVIGCLVALAAVAGLTAVMLPFRAHLTVATPALVLVVPVVLGVSLGGEPAGGLPAGVTAVAAGFVAWDFFFIPPYGTLSVGHPEDWLALVVYVVVMLVVARVVAVLQEARALARRRQNDTLRLYELSDLLISDKPLPELLQLVVDTLMAAFAPRWVAVLLPEGGSLAVAATAGQPLPDDARSELAPVAGRPQRIGPDGAIVRVALTTTTGPVGLLVMDGGERDRPDPTLIATFANHAALAIERAQLRDRALRSELLEQVDRWRSALLGAVSHDLRTPLSSVKAAVSTLRDADAVLSPDDRNELLELIEHQADDLARLVANLLDMTRIEAGAVDLQLAAVPVGDLVEEAVAALGAAAPEVRASLPDDLPPVEVDQVLMVQVLANLLQNAGRHSPEGVPVEVGAAGAGPQVVLTVRDHGPGVDPADRERIFQMFNRVSGAGRAGLGLTIAKAFVDAQGGTIRSEAPPGGGAAFVVTMPSAAVPADAA